MVQVEDRVVILPDFQVKRGDAFFHQGNALVHLARGGVLRRGSARSILFLRHVDLHVVEGEVAPCANKVAASPVVIWIRI